MPASRARSTSSGSSSTARVLVVGFGNALVADDGCGPAVVRRLGESRHVRALDGHSDALRLPALWHGEPDVWLVDALVRGARPGTVHHLAHDEILAVPQRHGTSHQLSLPESLRWIALTYPHMASIRYRLWGIEPGRLALVQGLTPEVQTAVETVCEEIRGEAARGARPSRSRGRS